MKKKIAKLNGQLDKLNNSQNFISRKHDNLADYYSEILQTNKQQKLLTKLADKIQKQNDESHPKIDILEQHDRRQNLELQSVLITGNEDVTLITLDLIKKLYVDIAEKDISIAHRHLRKRRQRRTGANKLTSHPTIIVRLVCRQKRNKNYANRLKAYDIDGLPVDNTDKLLINENLTHRLKRLFWNTKQKAQELGNQFF